jgi:hypothetical protein
MIKKLTVEEVEPLCGGAAVFHEAAGLPGKFSTASFCSQWRKLMDGQVGHVWAQFSGARLAQSFGLVVHPDPFTGEKAAAVLFWYLDRVPGNMGPKLFLEVMGWCDENDVSRLSCSARLNYKFAEMQEFLIGTGFRPTEVAFVTEL